MNPVLDLGPIETKAQQQHGARILTWNTWCVPQRQRKERGPYASGVAGGCIQLHSFFRPGPVVGPFSTMIAAARMARFPRKLAFCAVVASVAFGTATPALAVEDGESPWAKGFEGFMSGYIPPQSGFYGSAINYYFSGTAGANTRNGFVEFGIDTTMDVQFLAGLYVTDWSVFGGQYAFGGAIDWAWLNLSASLNTPLGGIHADLNNNAFGDSLWQPAVFAWHEGSFNWNLTFNVYAPTGYYSPHITTGLSIGRNIWAFMPQFSFTWFDPKIGWDASGSLIYVTQSNNNATDYQSGDLIQLDWALGKHFGTALEWEAGVAGNLVEQITGDTGSGAKLGPFEASSFGIGPALSYNTKFYGVPANLGAKWEHDVYAHNTFKGDVLNFTVGVTF